MGDGMTMESRPGSYALILKSTVGTSITVGRMGSLDVIPGYYVYVGSAFGPGGVRARVLRHNRIGKIQHWHIDYLRELVDFKCAWYSFHADKLEHLWAETFACDSMYSAIKGFGCSDCHCDTHLFYSRRPPDFKTFTCKAGSTVQQWLPDVPEFQT